VVTGAATETSAAAKARMRGSAQEKAFVRRGGWEIKSLSCQTT
jgi:hypothetical protein